VYGTFVYRSVEIVPTDLWERVQAELLPYLPDGRFRVTHRGSRWEFQTVDLRDGVLLIRILSERRPYEVWFTSVLDPLEWYTAAEIGAYLGVPTADLTASDVSRVLRALKGLLDGRLDPLYDAFSEAEYPTTKAQLLELRRAVRATQADPE
jgi:hypothetical protein